MIPLRRMGGDAANLAHFPVTLEIAGTIQTSRHRNHRCVFWKPTMLKIITNPEVVSKVTVKQAMRERQGRRMIRYPAHYTMNKVML
jgi:hypothetical protein